MAAQQFALDVVADNLANADVAGFKGKTARFATIGGDALLGASPAGTEFSFAQGKLMKSGGPFDVAIDGRGFFVVERGGQTAYTRAGAFTRAAGGRLVNDEGWALRGVRVPAGVLSLTVERGGAVIAEGGRRIGTIRLVAFDAPERLRGGGSALFFATPASGPPRRIEAGATGGPAIAFGMLERSNVNVIEAMMGILTAQRAYEANAKGVQAADEMQRIANNLHRS
jgi:flagellar basal-body rod protein FlgG